MAEPIPLPIANGFYISDSRPISAQECTNWYPNIVQAPALNQETLFGTPGSEQLATSGQFKQINRGAGLLNKIPYFVNGTTLYRLDRTIVDEVESFSLTDLGEIEGEGRVSVVENGFQLMILVPGGKGYIFTTDPDTLTEITDPGFTANGNPQLVVFVDSYFVVTTDQKRFIHSAVNNGLSWDATDVGTAESDPDEIVAPFVLNNQLVIGGTKTLEFFENIGGADFVFQRTGLFIETGIVSKFAIAKINKRTVFIGAGEDESPAIWALEGNTTTKVSTTAIDSILQDFTDEELDEAFAWSYAQKGAYFFGFSLPTTTLVYDEASKRWHERKSRIEDELGESRIVRSRINSLVSAYGRVIVGDAFDGRVGSLNPDIYTEYGNNIIRVVATQPFQNNMKSFRVPKMELTMESGVGDSTTPDPQIRMDRSLNGKTFGPERKRSVGKVGEFEIRQIWNRNGRAKRFEVFRFTMSDPVKPVIIQLTANIK